MARQLAVLLVGIVLARIIGPNEYGVITMATVLVGFVTLFDDLGIETALVRIRDTDEVQQSSVLWFSLALGFVLALITAASGIPIARFFHEPLLVNMIAVLALRFPISSLGIVQRAELQRKLDFRTLSRIGVISVATGGTFGIISALFGAGAWALVFQELLTATASVIQLWATSSWRPQSTYRRDSLRGLLRFGFFLMAVQVNNYLTRNIDNVLIGRVYGKTELALYNRGYSFVYLALFLAITASTVLFPTLAEVGNDMPRVRRVFLRVVGVVVLLTWPAVVGLFVTADPFVRCVFGPKWIGMIPFLRLLSPVALWQSVAALHGLLFQARGRTDLQFRVNSLSNILSIAGICIGISWGAKGVATGYLITSAGTSAINLHFALAQVRGSIRDIAAVVWRTGACCLVMAASVAALLFVLPGDWVPLLRLLPAVVAGVLVYGVCVAIAKPVAWEDLRRLLRPSALRTGSS